MQPSLIPLLQTVRGIDRLLPLHDGSPDIEYDVDIELNELPYLFRTTLANIPADVPYIFVEPARDDSPWYPTMRVFRQRKEGKWEKNLGQDVQDFAG
jgi:hypothetical protein